MTPDPNAPPSEDLFRYGWRYVPVTRADGTTDLDQVPLTLEDVLHPREGDVIPERPVHEKDRAYLAAVLRARPLGPPVVQVTSDCLVDWGVEGVRPHAPDVAVFLGLKEVPDDNRGTLYLAESGGRCAAVIEVVSPDTRDNDVDRKFHQYHDVGIPLYVIIDWPSEKQPRVLRGYRRSATAYEELAPDADGKLYLRRLGLRLMLRGGRVVCFDGQTGEEIGGYEEVSRQRDEAVQQNNQLREDLEESTLIAREERIARERAERRAEEMAAARAAAEDRVRELEEQLRRLAAANPPNP